MRGLGIVLAALLGAGMAMADLASPIPDDPELMPTTAVSHDRRIWVSSTNGAVKLDAMRWANSLITRMEEMVDATWRSSQHELHIQVLASEGEEGKVQSGLHVSRGVLIHQLRFRNFESLSRIERDEALCHLLLGAYVVAHGESKAKGAERNQWINGQVLQSIPRWFSRGFGQNLTAARRSRNSEVVLDAWEGGNLPLLVTFLRDGGIEAPDRELDDAYSGLIVTRLIMLPGSKERLSETFRRLAEGKPLSPGWMVDMLPGCETPLDVDAQWDAWMLAQRRRVIKPGGLAPRDIDRLRKELVVYPGDFGVPMSSDWATIITFRQLIAHREAPWMPTFAAGRILGLRTAALGKNKRLQPVIDEYCIFLEALGDRKRAKKLNALLDSAEASWRALIAEMGDPSVAPGDPELLPSDRP